MAEGSVRCVSGNKGRVKPERQECARGSAK